MEESGAMFELEVSERYTEPLKMTVSPEM